MNIAIIGSNCVVEAMIQRFSSQENVDIIYTYDLPQYMCNWPKVDNTPLSGDYRQFWLHEAELMRNKNLDLIITTGLIPQLWKEFHHKLKSCGVPLLAPSPEVARLEWSKAECKTILHELNIPTPKYEIVTYENVLNSFKQFTRPYVLKYDEEYREGLQTVIVTDDNVEEQYEQFVKYGSKKISTGFSPKNNTLFVREEYISGCEYSYHVLCNGTECTFLGAARDYKKRFEGDVGHNTVGMGAYSPVDYIDHVVMQYAQKILKKLNDVGVLYNGIMYLGIIVDKENKHQLLEVNTRFGDPEFSSILPTIETDIIQSFIEAASGKSLTPIEFNDRPTLCLRLVHKEYSLFNKPNNRLPRFTNVPDDILVTNSSGSINFGPMLTTTQDSLKLCAHKLQTYIQTIDLGDYTYRKDVGYFI